MTMGSRGPRDFLPAAPPAARFYAYAIDWAAGGIVSGAPAVLMYAAVAHRSDMFSNLYMFEALGYPWAVGVSAGLLCLLAAIAYFVLVPWRVWPGQTLGKRIAKLAVVRMGADDAAVSLPRLLVRQVLVGFLLEGSGFVVARLIRETAVLVTRVDVNYYWEIAGMALTAISAILAFGLPSRRALHDLVAGTRVVPAVGHPLS